jgi:energy-converting hydrogenase Eha subunit C
MGVIFSYFPAKQLLTPEFYLEALDEVDLFNRLPKSIAGQLAASLASAPGEAETRISLLVLEDQEWEDLLVELIEPEWLKNQSELLIHQFFDILLVSADPLNTPVEISVRQVKDNLAGPEGVQAINQIIAAQPPCSVEQLLGLVQTGLGMESSINSLLFKPPDFILSELDPLLESFLSATVSQMPDEIQFLLPFNKPQIPASTTPDGTVQELIPKPIQTLRQANTLITWLPLLPVAFLLLLTISAVKSINDLLTWWGRALFSAGLISLVLALFLVPIATWAIRTYTPVEMGSLLQVPELLVQIGLVDLLQALAGRLWLSIIIPASILTGVGSLLLLGAYMITRKIKRESLQSINSDSFPPAHN